MSAGSIVAECGECSFFQRTIFGIRKIKRKPSISTLAVYSFNSSILMYNVITRETESYLLPAEYIWEQEKIAEEEYKMRQDERG